MSDKRKELLRACFQNEVDYWNLPQYGLIADWFLRYWELHNLVLEHFDEEIYPDPIENYHYNQEVRHVQRANQTRDNREADEVVPES